MKYPILSLLLILSLNGFCQVKGTVIDIESKSPIPYSNIWIENEEIGTTSEMNGSFGFSESHFGKVLIISAVGYESQHKLIDSSSMKIQLVPKLYAIPEIIVKPAKKTELIISKYNKSQIITYSGINFPQIYARYFPYKDEYENTPIIKSIKIETISTKASCFKLRFMTVNSEGEAENDILKDNLVIKVKKGRRSLVIDNFNGAQIQIPKEGLFIAVEFLIIEENKYEASSTDNKTNMKKKFTVYMPFIGAQKSDDINNGWVYREGKWKNNEFNQIFTKTPKGDINYCIAMEVALTN